MDSQTTAGGRQEVRLAPARAVVVGEIVALVAGIALIAITAGSARWWPAWLAVIAVMSVVSDLTGVESGVAKLKVSGSFLGIVLAAVLLGGGPAAFVGILTISIGWFRFREAPHYLLNNVVAFTWFPLISGLAFHAAVNGLHIGTETAPYYLLVFAAFALALSLNFLGVAAFQCHLDRSPLLNKTREALMPVLSAELFSV